MTTTRGMRRQTAISCIRPILSDLRLPMCSPSPTMMLLGAVVSVFLKHVLLCLPLWRDRFRNTCTAATAPLAHGVCVVRAVSATHATRLQLRASNS